MKYPAKEDDDDYHHQSEAAIIKDVEDVERKLDSHIVSNDLNSKYIIQQQQHNNNVNNIDEIDGTTNINKKQLSPASSSSDRGQWSTGIEFLLSCISMSVGLGNVWRFPYVAYENGGGAFLIPYFLLLFLIGRPIYYLELILGQFSGRGPIKMWKCVPLINGLGFAQLFSTSYISIYYNYLMGISLFYLFASFSRELPWNNCSEVVLSNLTCPEYYYERVVLNKSEGLWDINSISWKLALCLIASWILVYLSIVKGISSLGKVAYFTAIFPYVVLLTLFAVSLTQEGAIDGIIYFFKPEFGKLLDPIVWYRAVEQSFFSLAVCFGSLVMYSSYNNFNNNVNRDAIIISVLDTFTSLLAGCVIFAVLGAMAHQKNKDIKDIVSAGQGLAFIAYPEGLSKIKFIPQLWSVLFFFMLFTLGIGSSVAMIETILTCIRDRYESLQRHKAKLAFIFCFVFMLLGLPLTTDAGSYIMLLLDNYGVGTAAFLYGIIEVLAIVLFYGLNNFLDDVHFMLKSRPSRYWRITWGFLTPLVLIVIFIYGNIMIFQNNELRPGMPKWGNDIGWVLAGLALIQIPFWGFISIFKQKGSSFIEKAQLSLQPAKDWGPIDDRIFNEWANFKVQKSFDKVFDSTSTNDSDSNGGSPIKGSDNFGFLPDGLSSESSSQTSQISRAENKSTPKLLSNIKINFD